MKVNEKSLSLRIAIDDLPSRYFQNSEGSVLLPVGGEHLVGDRRGWRVRFEPRRAADVAVFVGEFDIIAVRVLRPSFMIF